MRFMLEVCVRLLTFGQYNVSAIKLYRVCIAKERFFGCIAKVAMMLQRLEKKTISKFSPKCIT